MKSILFYCIIALSFFSCEKKPSKKFYIKSVQLSDSLRVDWYINSSITSFKPDYLQLSADTSSPFFISTYLTDIRVQNDSLVVVLWKNSFDKMPASPFHGYKIIIDSSGQVWNNANSRFGRLKSLGVNLERPHFQDVSCPNGECYDGKGKRY